MISIIFDLLSPFWPYILAALAFLGWGFAKRREGRKEERLAAQIEQAQDAVKAHEVRNEVENRIASDRDKRAAERLRDEWSE